MVDADLQGAHCLEQGFLDGAPQGHDLAGGLHLSAEAAIGPGELVEGPARNLGDDVVEHGLEHRPGRPGHGIADLVEGHTDGDLRGDLGDRVAGGLGGQGRGPRDSRVDLDDVVLEGLRVQGELDVAASLDAQRPDYLDRRVAQHLVLDVGEGLGGGEDDGVSGVDTDRVEILHGADDHGVVGAVAHHLVLDLLVPGDRLLDQALRDRGEFQTLPDDANQFGLVMADTAAGTAESVGGTDDERVTDGVTHLNRLVDGVDDLGSRHRLAQLVHELLEQVTVLRLLNGGELGAQQFDAQLVEDPGLGQFGGQVEAGLTAQGGDDGVGTFPAQDRGDEFQGDRFDVDLVGDVAVGHDRGWVGVDEDDLVPLLLEGQTGLGAGVVELGGLTDDDRTGSDDEDAMQVGAAGHQFWPPE